MREAIAAWLQRRHALRSIDAATQVLPILGTREALFAIAQTVIDASRVGATVVAPNPFYQIYEGAALLAGATPHFVNSGNADGGAPRWADVPETVWARTQLLYVCSPDNPTGRVTTQDEWRLLFELSDRHGFVIAADECYSEIYFDESTPPLGSLAAAQALGRSSYPRLLAFGSLSKRSNAPGLRSGYVAGDAKLIKAFLRYRTYHGSAMSPAVAAASIAAWNDETHVRANRTLYAEKFRQLRPLVDAVLPAACRRPRSISGRASPATTPSSRAGCTRPKRSPCCQAPISRRTVDGVNPGSGTFASHWSRRWTNALRLSSASFVSFAEPERLVSLRAAALRRARNARSRDRAIRRGGSTIAAMNQTQPVSWWTPLTGGVIGVSWQTVALIVAINFGFAAILSIEDVRPFWHPLITAQCFGLAIAYAVNAARPWERDHPVRRLVVAVAIGTVVGFALLILVKIVILNAYTWDELLNTRRSQFAWTAFSGFTSGTLVSLFFLIKFRESHAQAQILKAEADRNLLSKQAVEAELKLMQAQVEPHFLFNTLASVQFLVETDPPQAARMLGHLLEYLRAALPQLRSDSATLGQEVDLAQAYLSIMQMRMGSRCAWRSMSRRNCARIASRRCC